jgi:hypothetical protein
MTRSKAGKLGDVVRVIIAEPIPGSRSDDASPDDPVPEDEE